MKFVGRCRLFQQKIIAQIRFAIYNSGDMMPHRLAYVFNNKLIQIARARQIIMLCACVWFCVFAASDAQAQYRLDHWTADNGLPQNSVHDILQTRDGYLWIATLDGLARFDGVRFTVFNKSNSQGISSNRFLFLREDVNGDFWAGTEDGGVVRYHQGRFKSYGREHGLTSLQIAHFPITNDGSLLVTTIDGQWFRFSDEKFLPISQTPNAAISLPVRPQENVRAACIYGFDEIGSNVYGTKLIWTMADGLPSLNLTGLSSCVLDRNGVFWMGLYDGGLVRIENDRIVKIYTERDGLPGEPFLVVPGERVSIMTRDKQSAYWLTDIEKWQHQPFAKQLPSSISDFGNTIVYEDRESNFWFGTLFDGLFRARKQSIRVYSKPEGVTDKNVYPIYEDKNGVVWIGTTDGLFSYKDGKFTLKRKGSITAFAEDKAGRLLIGAFNELLALEGERFVLLHLGAAAQGTSPVIWTVYPDKDGSTIWFGAENGLGKLKDGVYTLYTTKDGLAGDDTKVIIDDKAGGFWIGSYGGLSHYKDGKFISWTERDGLPSRTVRSLYQDNDGTLWIGTYDGGLGRFKDGKFTRYTSKEGLFNNGVFQILEDGRGWFWISSNRGIYRVSKQELNEFAEGKINLITSIAYSKSDGLLNVECNGGRWPAGIKSRDGKMWFPTQDGVAMIDPDVVPVNGQPPPVKIESFLLDRDAIAFDKEVAIQPHQVNFEIGYTALSFINSENMRFKYKLEGLDHDWIEAGTRRTAYFSHVPPGSYTFKVIAANSDGIWNMDGASVKVVVYPRFYQTWWFISLAALCVSGLVVLIFKARIKHVEKERKAQEEFSRRLLASQEQERQRIAAELHDSLGQSLLIIKNRIALAQSDIDERETVEEQLDELSHSATSAIDECREIAYNLRPYQISRFGLSKTLYGIFMRINEVTKIHATAEIDTIDELLTDEGQINLYRVVQECVNNIIKHSGASEASLFIKRDGDEITLLIQDNGRGFVESENKTDETKRGGFGLIGMAERVKMLGGDYKIDSIVGQGTNIRVKLKANRHIEEKTS